MSCHPSVHSIGSMVKDDPMAIVNSVACAQFVAATKDEPSDWKPNGKVQHMLSSKPFADANEFYVYSNEAHGFLTRGDTKHEHTQRAIGDTIEKMVSFVNKVSA